MMYEFYCKVNIYRDWGGYFLFWKLDEVCYGNFYIVK